MEDSRDEDGHARARTWKFGEEHKEAYEREHHKAMKDEIGNGAMNTGDENCSLEHGKKSKIPSFCLISKMPNPLMEMKKVLSIVLLVHQ